MGTSNTDYHTTEDLSETGSSNGSLPPKLQEYYERVGRIEILRDRLSDLETSLHEALGEITQLNSSETTVGSTSQDEKALSSRCRSSRIRTRRVLDIFFEERLNLIGNLLQAIDAAQTHRTLYIAELGEVHRDDEPCAWKEAVEYTHEESYGSMYAISHTGSHRGVRPIDLAQVPYLHREERILHWLRDFQHTKSKSTNSNVSLLSPSSLRHTDPLDYQDEARSKNALSSVVSLIRDPPERFEHENSRESYVKSLDIGSKSREGSEASKSSGGLPCSEPYLSRAPHDSFSSWTQWSAMSSIF